MKRFCHAFAAVIGIFLSLTWAQAATMVFSENFESGLLSAWTTTATSPLAIDNTANVEPSGGTYSALLDNSLDRMHHNLIADNGGSELSGYAIFSSFWYDNSGTATRFYNEIRGYSGGTGLPNGGTTASGTLGQLLAIGKYNSVTMAGEVYNGTKYQARVVTGANTGWFNLDAPGSPNRSIGWHKFTIERMYDGTTLNFYVDDILSRTITGAAPESFDTLILGSGLGSTVGNAWADGLLVVVPEPSTLSYGLMGGIALLGFARRRQA